MILLSGTSPLDSCKKIYEFVKLDKKYCSNQLSHSVILQFSKKNETMVSLCLKLSASRLLFIALNWWYYYHVINHCSINFPQIWLARQPTYLDVCHPLGVSGTAWRVVMATQSDTVCINGPGALERSAGCAQLDHNENHAAMDIKDGGALNIF